MEHFDIVIIGAGLAGCTLGHLLLKNNKKIIIIENQDLKKKNKLCGGIVTQKAYQLLLKIYENKIKKLDFKHFTSFKVKNNDIIKEIINQNLFTINRKDLDDFVVSEFLANGGVILDNTNYEKIDFKKKIIYVSGKLFKYDKLVGADGVLSKVRRDLTHHQQRMNFAVESEYQKNDEILQIDFLSRFKGYAWIIANHKHHLVGLGDVSRRKDIKDKFLNYFHLKNNKTVRGAFLPTGDNIFLKKGSTYFIGDAAGLASPVIGEGIYYALSSAYHLSQSLNNIYKIRMLKDRFIITCHRISKLLIYNTCIRNFFYKFYGKSKIITFLIQLALKTFI